MTATTVHLTLNHVGCARCGVVFGITREYEERRRADHKEFFCPAGHGNFYGGKSEAEKLRDELAREKHRAEQARAWAEDEARRREVANRRAAAARGQVTRIKNRVRHGVCPCCKRTFQQLARHMASQHPDYTEASDA